MQSDLAAVMRRRRVRRVARSSAPRVLSPTLTPSDVAYRAELLHVAHSTQQLIMERVWPLVVELSNARRDAADDSPAAQLRRLFEKVRFLIPERTPAAEKIAARVVADVNKTNRNAMNAQFRAVVPIDVFGENIGAVAPTLRAAVKRNVDLIESIPMQLLDDVKDTILPEIEAGTRVEGIRDLIQERFGVSDRRAALIARDQVGKLNGELSQERQQSVGVTSYEWWCVLDERVRHIHEALHGKTFAWNDPPVVAENPERREHPGGDYQCRCQARPNVSALLDSLGLSDDEAPAPVSVSVPEALETPAKITSEASTALSTALSAQSPELPGARSAALGFADRELDYVRTGMRDLSQARAGYAGAAQAEIDAIASGLRPSRTGRTFEPIKLISDVVPSLAAAGVKFALEDGRHRLVAARDAGARYIVATVDGERVIIPLPR